MAGKVRELAKDNLFKILFTRKISKKSQKDIAYFIWAIDNFGHRFPDAEIRIGIEVQENGDFQELVLRINEEILWIGLEAIHRTGIGSDSYEVEYFIGILTEVSLKIPLGG